MTSKLETAAPRAHSLLLAFALIACSQPRPEGDRAPAATSAGKAEAPAAAATPVDDGPPVRLYASKYVSKIRSAPSKEAPRIGYLRGGAVLSAKTKKPLGFDACRKGWYELETGGFVCSTTDVIAFEGKRLPERRPTQPTFDKPLPYPYGYARTKNTPVYKRLPTDEEAAQYEGYKIPGAPAVAEAGEAEAGATAVGIAPAPGAAAPVEAPAVVEAPIVEPTVLAPQAAGTPGVGDADAGPPTLASLQGEQGTVLVRRMQRGFYVSLDREIDKGARSYWQTQSAGYIPKSRIWLVEGSEFHGVDLQAGGLQLPLGFVMSKDTQAHAPDPKGRMRPAGRPGYHFVFPIVSSAELRGRPHYVDDKGVHYPAREVTRVEARARPTEVAADEKWIDIDLSTQSLVAYVGDKPVYATLISSGRVKDELDPLRNFVTPTGSFRLTSKHLTATMDGDHALDGPYSIEDVPYVMYFQLAYALHSAFWHNSFGRPRSHGCINLAPIDAKWLFFWATPVMPQLWHGVFPSDQDPGTRLYIRGETPKG